MLSTSVRFSRTNHHGALNSISNCIYPEKKKKKPFLYHVFILSNLRGLKKKRPRYNVYSIYCCDSNVTALHVAANEMTSQQYISETSGTEACTCNIIHIVLIPFTFERFQFENVSFYASFIVYVFHLKS